jgi:hypothetical protein
MSRHLEPEQLPPAVAQNQKRSGPPSFNTRRPGLAMLPGNRPSAKKKSPQRVSGFLSDALEMLDADSLAALPSRRSS